MLSILKLDAGLDAWVGLVVKANLLLDLIAEAILPTKD
jgi:hypothetical protein